MAVKIGPSNPAEASKHLQAYLSFGPTVGPPLDFLKTWLETWVVDSHRATETPAACSRMLTQQSLCIIMSPPPPFVARLIILTPSVGQKVILSGLLLEFRPHSKVSWRVSIIRTEQEGVQRLQESKFKGERSVWCERQSVTWARD